MWCRICCDAVFHAIADHIPLGQPIGNAHHSAPAARSDWARMDGHLWASVEHDSHGGFAVTGYQRRAGEAQAATGARHAPVTVANRIARLESELRELQRRGEHFASRGVVGGLDEPIERTGQDLEHWRRVRGEQLASGQIREFGPGTVQAGDRVLISGQWRTVVRANAKSVTVTTGYSWTDRAPWARVVDHRSASGDPGPGDVAGRAGEMRAGEGRVVGQEPG